jgi:hypothetical protein
MHTGDDGADIRLDKESTHFPVGSEDWSMASNERDCLCSNNGKTKASRQTRVLDREHGSLITNLVVVVRCGRKKLAPSRKDTFQTQRTSASWVLEIGFSKLPSKNDYCQREFTKWSKR